MVMGYYQQRPNSLLAYANGLTRCQADQLGSQCKAAASRVVLSLVTRPTALQAKQAERRASKINFILDVRQRAYTLDPAWYIS